MTDTPTTRMKLRQMSAGSNVLTWGDDKLNEVMRLIDRSTKGVQSLTITGDTTLSWTNYVATNDGQVAWLTVTGSLSSSANLVVPSVEWTWQGIKNTTGQAITVKTAAGTGVSIPNGRQISVYCDGTDCYAAGDNYGGVSVASNALDIPNYTAVAALITAASSGISGGYAVDYYYTATGGETSKSGADDFGLTLSYTPGTATEVYLNGVKLENSVDYVASTGTSITSLSALTAGDILHVRAYAVFSVASAYTQAQVDALLAAIYTNTHTWSAAQTFNAGTLKLASSGGTSQVLKQTSSGGAITVAQLAASDLSNGTTGSGAVALAESPVFITQITTPKVVSSAAFQIQATSGDIDIKNRAAIRSALAILDNGAIINGFRMFGSTAGNAVTFGAVGDDTDISINAATQGAGVWNLKVGSTLAVTLSIKSAKTALNGTWPTSSAGLATGDLWNNSGVINVA